MIGTVRVYRARLYYGILPAKRTLVWVAAVHGMNGKIRKLTPNEDKQHVLRHAASESAFTGFPIVQAGRDERLDDKVRV